jgi:hypothetical protein
LLARRRSVDSEDTGSLWTIRLWIWRLVLEFGWELVGWSRELPDLDQL